MKLQLVQSQAHKHSFPCQLYFDHTSVVYRLWELQKHMAKSSRQPHLRISRKSFQGTSPSLQCWKTSRENLPGYGWSRFTRGKLYSQPAISWWESTSSRKNYSKPQSFTFETQSFTCINSDNKIKSVPADHRHASLLNHTDRLIDPIILSKGAWQQP